MANSLKQYWLGLQARERLVLGWGGIIVTLIILYYFLLGPFYNAINTMEESIQPLRENLTWMRQQSDRLKSAGGANLGRQVKGGDQSLLSVIEQTAKRAKVSGAIQQMVPNKQKNEVRVVLDGANFNQWVRWIDELFKQYGVDIKQVTAERDEDKPNVAEIRLTFVREG